MLNSPAALAVIRVRELGFMRSIHRNNHCGHRDDAGKQVGEQLRTNGLCVAGGCQLPAQPTDAPLTSEKADSARTESLNRRGAILDPRIPNGRRARLRIDLVVSLSELILGPDGIVENQRKAGTVNTDDRVEVAVFQSVRLDIRVQKVRDATERSAFITNGGVEKLLVLACEAAQPSLVGRL